MYPKATTLADIDITKTREARILQEIANRTQYLTEIRISPSKGQTTRSFVQQARASETEAKAISQVQQRQKEEELETVGYEGSAPDRPADSKLSSHGVGN